MTLSDSGPYVEVTLEALADAHLEDCAAQLDAADDIPLRLFLAARSAHLALVTSLTAAVAGTAGVGAFTKPVRKEWLRYLGDLKNGLTDPPTGDRVLSFTELLRIARRAPQGYLQQPLAIDATDEDLIDRLTRLRDRTEHPRPEVHFMEPAWIVRPIMVGTRWGMHCLQAVWHHLDAEQQARALTSEGHILRSCAALLPPDQPAPRLP